MKLITGDLFLEVGPNKSILVDPLRITRRMSDTLNSKLGKCRLKYSVYDKIKPEEGESAKKFKARLKKWAVEQDKLTAKQSAEEFLTEIFESKAYKTNMDFMFDCVVSIAETMGQEAKLPDTEPLMDIPVVEINNFVARVCMAAKVPTEFEEIMVDGGSESDDE